MTGFHGVGCGGRHSGEEGSAAGLAVKGEGHRHQAAHAVVVVGSRVGIVDAIGQRALADEVGVEGMGLFDAGLDFGVLDPALVS